MIILLDYDGTYTIDPTFWKEFIFKSNIEGHTVYGLTMRHNNQEESIDNTLGKYCEIIYTGRKAKKEFAFKWLSRNNVLPKPVVFIDDQPDFLLHDSL